MRNIVKNAAAGAVIGGSLLCAGGMAVAQAAPPQPSADGKVNVTLSSPAGQIGVIQDVSVGNAATLVSSLCADPSTITTDVLNQIGAGTLGDKTCTSAQGGLTLAVSHSGPGNSENAPGHNRATTVPPAPTTTANGQR